MRGLRRKGSGYYIHTSGALSLAMESVVTGWYGEAFGKVYDDWDKVGEVTSLPDHAPHRKVDKVVLGAGSDAIKTAIVAPAAIYGVGRGPDKTRSFLLYGPLLKRQKVFIVGNGENVWHCVHVQDLSAIYLLLAESAVRGDSIPGEWNEEGYYLAENGSYVAREMLELTAQIAHRRGFIPSSEVDVLTPDEAEKVFPWASFVLGADSRGHGVRAKKLLGWKPKMPSFDDEIENALEIAHRGMV